MTGFRALLGKELMEIRRTWKIWVLPGLLLFLALTGPVAARFTKELVESVMVGDLQITIPDPTWQDTLTQWNKNLGQLGTLAVLLVFGGVISGEARQGTHVLIVTKPVSRRAYVLAKFAAAAVLLVAATMVAMLVEHVVSLIFFPDAQLVPLVGLTGAWLVQAMLWLAVVLVASGVVDSPIAASGVGLGVVMVVALVGLWRPAVAYSPAGIGDVMVKITAGQQPGWVWPIATACVLTGTLVWLACVVFQRREL